MRQEGVPVEPTGFGARDTQGTVGLTEFQVGQQFQDKEEAVLSLKTYSIRRGVQYKVVESDYRQYVGKCYEFGNGCTWLIRLSLWKRKGIWEVKRYNGPHTCLATSISSDHRSLDYHVISAFIMPMVRADASVCIKILLNATEAHFGFRSTYRRVWLAKQKAVAYIYGDWDESYNDLPRWVLGVQLTMHGSVAVLRTSFILAGSRWTVRKPIFTGFSGHSHHVLRHFGIVSCWRVLMGPTCTVNMGHVTLQPGILVISDKHNGIKVALEAADGGWLPLAVYRAFYIRLVAANFALTFKGKDARRLLVNAAYAKTEVEFDYWFDILRSEDPAMCDWENRIDYSLWTQHRDEGRRFRHMTINISECVNSILKGVRNLPVCSLVKATYGKVGRAIRSKHMIRSALPMKVPELQAVREPMITTSAILGHQKVDVHGGLGWGMYSTKLW
ncbi:uncharacterized protein LOC107490089 [Arachis duranensis]|uniref:Uncharacterized protein LOC107490089 n=1 Tax=Arachis duranensis TaxID=130453 RepID=A0A6P4DDE0_ARADU|nr:uncharacterized protein LOC107490089 [Arachis duranensis]